jgi:hypothetical protein
MLNNGLYRTLPKLLSQFEIAKGTLQRIHVPGFPPVTFEMVQECHPVGYWVTAKIDGFEPKMKRARPKIRAGKGSSVGSPAPTPRDDVYQQGPHQQRHPLHRRTNPGPHP